MLDGFFFFFFVHVLSGDCIPLYLCDIFVINILFFMFIFKFWCLCAL